MIKIMCEFHEFLREYKVIGLAIGVVMGITSTALIKSLVDNIIMPIFTPFLAAEEWRTATLTIGPVVIKWGAFTAELINFIVIAFVIFLFAKFIMREEKVCKK